MKNQKLLELATGLFMKFGIKSVSMDDISKEAGVSKKTIYNVIPNKAQLINKVVIKFIKDEHLAIQSIKEESTDALDEMINITDHVLEFLRGFNPSLTYDLRKYYKQIWTYVEDQHFSFIIKSINENIERGKKEGIYRNELHADIISRLYMQSSRQMVDVDLFPLSEFPRVVLFQNFVEYHIFGILSEKGLKQFKKYKARS